MNRLEKKILRRLPKGFTLTEMLVVVAITAVIAAISIPSYRKSAARSRQKEAIAALTSIYAVERTFSVDSGSFTLCLSKIGYNPRSDLPVRYYSTGFLAHGDTVGTNCGPYSNATCLAYSFSANGTADQQCTLIANNDCQGAQDNCFQATAYMNQSIAALTYNDVTAGATVSRGSFTASAIGSVSTDAKKDRWSIDENKNLINTLSGI